MRSFVHALPKVELHVHLVGSASVDTVLGLARRHPEAGVPTDRAALADFYEFRDFEHFLKVFWAVQSMLRDRHDIAALVVGLAGELAAQNVRYAEVTVTPYNHVTDGMPLDELLAGLTEGRAAAAASGVDLAWVFDIPGEKGTVAGRETLTVALRDRPDGLVGFGLGGPEVGIGRAQFEPFFTAAREAGLHSVPHAGETSGPATVWSAVHDLGAERIGHGTSSANTGSRSRSARPRTCGPGRSSRSRRTRCGGCSTTACSSPSPPTTRRCSARPWRASTSRSPRAWD
jgi:aminodeoxyfutalosine deaminase